MQTPPLARLYRASLPLALLGLALSSCGKPSSPPREVLPPVTETGLNKAGAMVNGTVWRALSANLFGPQAMRAHVFRTTGSGRGFEVSLSLTRQAPEGSEKYYPYPDSNISFFLPSVLAPGTFALDQAVTRPFPSEQGRYGLFSDYSTSPIGYYPTGTAQGQGQLVISRFDTVARVVAGTFEFTGQRDATLITITQGRFDISY
ncbi:hypothetical protein [Hymenobacter psychrophilus]|uniref:Uncharacterized protein n=1 Tax=Hymenobacter psychrophilus TaxID=651662 RepID=A0A1H3NYW0_9BACT|nr:hypothetical protein [Hymenobacter psychrophilus]SDY94082.1 hypothetical protein SAMN04488069_12014 [Hymenobacter psychrophilus]